MGGLRDKAQSEEMEHKEAAMDRAQERLAEHDERRQMAIDGLVTHLSEWSGEKISPSMLKPVSPPEPHMIAMGTPVGMPRWTITIDGFELRVVAFGIGMEDFIIEHSPTGSDLWREINKPHELLKPVADPDARPAGIIDQS